MNTPVERFNKRKAKSNKTVAAETTTSEPHVSQPEDVTADAILASITLDFDADSKVTPANTDGLLAEIHGKLDDEKIAALLEACQKECLQAVIRPFGLAKVLFQDIDGGNVDTIHNVRRDVFATDQERTRYESRENYSDVKGMYKQDKNYRDENAKISKRKLAEKNEKINDSYTDNVIGLNEDRDLDHVVPTSEIHNDAGIYLAELDPVVVANKASNLKPTNASINRSKNGYPATQFAARLRKQSEQRKAIITQLEAQGNLTDEQAKEINKLKKLETVNEIKLLEADAAARKEINGSVNEAYYKSSKFVKNVALTGVKEGGKMALQQAIGIFMEEFVRAAFAEIKDIWHNGFKGKVDDAFLDVLKERLMRVAERVHGRWMDAATALKDGFVSGFLSNVLTVIINAFVTTAARWGRIIREGFMSLYRALKMLAFPPEGMSLTVAAHEASKLLAAGIVTGAGVLLEEVLEKAMAGISGPLAALTPYVSTIAVGLVTGLSAAFSVYMLDRLDLFGVNAVARHEHIVAKLDEMIVISYERAVDAAAVFDGPALLHLSSS